MRKTNEAGVEVDCSSDKKASAASSFVPQLAFYKSRLLFQRLLLNLSKIQKVGAGLVQRLEKYSSPN